MNISNRILFGSIIIGLSIGLFSCKTNYQVVNTDRVNTRITQNIAVDSSYTQIINPYKMSLDKEMKKVISYAEHEYTRTGTTTTLGNLLADLLYAETNNYCATNQLIPIDFILINHGGMRSNLFVGNITVGDIYEVSPFENELVIIEISGKSMKELLLYLQKEKKGHPVSQLFAEYKSEKIYKVEIGKIPFDENKNYRLATIDYLQNGGDNMSFLKNPIQKIETHLKLRDIFIKQISSYKTLPYHDEPRLIFEN